MYVSYTVSVPKLMEETSRADETAHSIVKSVYNSMLTHFDQLPVLVRMFRCCKGDYYLSTICFYKY